MRTFIDARGLECPKPVVIAKNSMKDADEIEIHVDNETAVENLKRLAASSGYEFSSENLEGFYRIILVRKGDVQSVSFEEPTIPSCSGIGTVVAVTSDAMGSGDDELGRLLMKAFIHTLTSLENKPEKVILYNTGAKLAADGSGVTDDLKFLSENGCEILICGTCVNYFDIKDKLSTGTVSNMFDIVNALNRAGRIIRP